MSAACSDDDSSADNQGGDSTAATGIPAAGTDPTAGPTTTFMPTCAGMPDPATISSLVGIPVADGEVVEAGTCQFLGVNDQSRVVFLKALIDPTDQAEFTDLQSSLGESVPMADPAGSMMGPDGTVYLTSNGTIYTVLTMVTDGSPVEQAPQSAAVLKAWLGL
ncbi:MAG TPA: hypothetical protein DCR14_15840 [Acidimicrobiaceae bacterium]|nr:hypothetical protein [Acidimicrobiaceae bacterium]